MSMFCCETKCRCILASVIVSAILGVLAAFLQITGVITVATPFLWVAFGIGVVYLAVLVIAGALQGVRDAGCCFCDTLDTLLAGILGSILVAVILLAVGITATGVVSAILVGLLVFFFTLTLTATACYVRKIVDCRR